MNVNDDFGWFRPSLILKANPQPPVPGLGPGRAVRRYCISKNKKGLPPASCAFESFGELAELAIQHRLEAQPADIVVCYPIEIVTDGYVVCGNRFGDGRRSLANVKEPARYFLPGSDFSKGTVLLGVEINLQSLFLRAGRFFRDGH